MKNLVGASLLFCLIVLFPSASSQTVTGYAYYSPFFNVHDTFEWNISHEVLEYGNLTTSNSLLSLEIINNLQNAYVEIIDEVVYSVFNLDYKEYFLIKSNGIEINEAYRLYLTPNDFSNILLPTYTSDNQNFMEYLIENGREGQNNREIIDNTYYYSWNGTTIFSNSIQYQEAFYEFDLDYGLLLDFHYFYEQYTLDDSDQRNATLTEISSSAELITEIPDIISNTPNTTEPPVVVNFPFSILYIIPFLPFLKYKSKIINHN